MTDRAAERLRLAAAVISDSFSFIEWEDGDGEEVARCDGMVGLAVSTASAQDAKTVLGNASKAMGVENLNSIHFYGTAQNGNLGQNNNANQPWPMAAQNDYVRAIDFSKPASRATWATYAVPVTGGRAALAQGTPQTQQLITPETTAWGQQLEIWITPWGFLKGAAANNATVQERRPSADGDIRS